MLFLDLKANSKSNNRKDFEGIISCNFLEAFEDNFVRHIVTSYVKPYNYIKEDFRLYNYVKDKYKIVELDVRNGISSYYFITEFFKCIYKELSLNNKVFSSLFSQFI